MATISNDRERHKLVPLSGGYTQCANPPSRGAREHEIIFLLAVKTLAVLGRDRQGHPLKDREAVGTFRNLAGGQNHSGSRKRIGETYIHISLYTYIPSIFWGKILIYLILVPYRHIYIIPYTSSFTIVHLRKIAYILFNRGKLHIIGTPFAINN
jgi:hypothetical protein